MHFNLYFFDIPKFKFRDLRCKSAIYRTIFFFNLLGLELAITRWLFVSEIYRLISETTLSVSLLEKSLYIQTDRVMNKVELDNSVNTYKAADALLLFARNAAKRVA